MTFLFLLILGGAVCASAAAAAAQDDRRLIFSTYQGGDRNDDSRAAAVDAAGNIYVAGETESRNLDSTPVGGKPLTAAVFKGYLTKYSPDGRKVLWRLLIGGDSNTVPAAVAVDRDGAVFVTGVTGAPDFPMKQAVQSKKVGPNTPFLMKFSGGGELLFSTYFGGERNDEPQALAIDSMGAVYIAGRATSSQFPVKDALQKTFGGSEDGFIAKFTPDLKLAYATYLGGEGADQIHAIAVGPDDSLYVTGETMSGSLATPGAYTRTMVSWSSFAARIAPDGSRLQYFTYVGWRGGYTVADAIAVDAAGRAWVGGHTTVRQLPTDAAKALQPNFGGGMRDGFLLRLTEDGSAADYLSYLGGSSSGPTDPDEGVRALRVEPVRGHLQIVGKTNSRDFPGFRALQSEFAGAFDGYAMRLDVDANQVIYSTFWGGRKNDEVTAVALGPDERVTIVGNSFSEDYPVTSEATQKNIGSANDGFVAQFCDPWLGSYSATGWANEVIWSRSAPGAEPVEIEVFAGCPQAFSAVGGGPAVGADWLRVTSDGGTVPMKLRISVDAEGLAVGEYKSWVRVTVNEAFAPVLEIPVTLRVVE